MLSQRFFAGYPWRFVVTLLTGETVTSLERLASGRTVTYRLNQPAVATGRVPSDDPRVNITDVEVGLDAPHVSFADRLLYGFRREATSPDSWVCRFAGLLTQIEDTADAGQPYSTFTAYDPWQYLFHRRLVDGTSDVGVDGLSFPAQAGNLIVEQILDAAIAVDGAAMVSYNAAGWDTTATLSGATITDPYVIQQGTSVGEALRQIVALGGMDIEFRPVYDPAQPGVCCTVHVHSQMGSVQDGAPFSWDVGRSVQTITSLLDGDQLSNDVRFHTGQGGPAVTPQVDATSQTRYGVYTAEAFWPAAPNQTLAVEARAQRQLQLRKQGRRSGRISPNPLLSPKPFLDYGLGDRVPVHATTRLRQAVPWANDSTVYQRVYGIPIVLGDDGVETVTSLVASPDGFS